ncbi:hypothetical protein [Actinokineospora iranica]|uniref:DUF3558 domain-containing protein n=1 Tax=Actinokineospora iranica TaxID=1271860 RepID=A0A1G6SJ09_9PSEU|nr:hypothetical protein [Actinokineospora iranica]SDD16849.1 hypothetical protein SAMN05216174_10812 [Actinokineospora iranica]
MTHMPGHHYPHTHPHAYPQAYPPPVPPKKSKAPLIVGIVVGVLLLGGAGTGVFFYLSAHADGGSPPSGDTLAQECDRVSAATRAKMRTTNPHRVPGADGGTGRKYVWCKWGQTEGVDGEGLRDLSVHMIEFTEANSDDQSPEKQAAAEFQGNLKSRRTIAENGVGADKTVVHKIEDIGDEAVLVEEFTDSAFYSVDLIFRKDRHVVTVGYQGWDAGLFSNVAPDAREFAGLVDAAAREVEAAL